MLCILLTNSKFNNKLINNKCQKFYVMYAAVLYHKILNSYIFWIFNDKFFQFIILYAYKYINKAIEFENPIIVPAINITNRTDDHKPDTHRHIIYISL